MADFKEAVPPELVSEIGEAVRLVLSHWIPTLLALPIEDLKKQSALEKHQHGDSYPLGPADHRAEEAECPDLSHLASSRPSDVSSSGLADFVTTKRTDRSSCRPFIPTVPVSSIAAAMDEQSSASRVSEGPVCHTRSYSWPCAEFRGTQAEGAAAGATAITPAKAAGVAVTAFPSRISFEDVVEDGKESNREPATPTGDSQIMEIALSRSAGQLEDGSEPLLKLMKHLHSGTQSERGNYTPIPLSDPAEEPANASRIMFVKSDGAETQEIMDPEAAQRLPEEMKRLEAKATAACGNLEDLQSLFESRRLPYESEIASTRKEIEKLKAQLELARMPKYPEPPPPGPLALKFVEYRAFAVVCNLVILLNLTAMIIGPRFEGLAGILTVMDQLFLAWYVVELSLKAMYYQRFLIIGKVSVVWWNWLDLGIVVSGVIDQWLEPLLSAMNGGHLDIDTSALRMLRILRLFRIMRFLKILKAFLQHDVTWTEGTGFELSVAAVVALNSVVMSCELDLPWAGWLYIENFFQVFYTFDLAVRFKRQGCHFFLQFDKTSDLMWNYLDFIMVSGCALDLWCLPLIYLLWEMLLDSAPPRRSSGFSGFLKILKIMRILRVLRLLRLLKVVPPLYRLVTGVMMSIKAMQWVLVLTFLTLYACAIVFTSMVGEGLLTDGKVSVDALRIFGSVPKSLYHLFRLMNGDISVVEPVADSTIGKLLFIGFTIISKWAILAILTSVVSDNMITASARATEEEEQRKNDMEHEKRIRRLTTVFKEADRQNRGFISLAEWQRMMQNESLNRELRDVTGLHEEDLQDYFECLATDPRLDSKERDSVSKGMADLRLDYRNFMEALKHEGQLADKRSILHVMKQLRVLESHMKTDLDEAAEERDTMFDRLCTTIVEISPMGSPRPTGYGRLSAPPRLVV